METYINVQKSLLGAMEEVASVSVSRLEIDKTVKAIVVRCEDATTGEYTVKYNGGAARAYVDDRNVSYSPNTLVYMLIPRGDISERKRIVGRVDAQNSDDFVFVSSIMDSFNPIGSNIVSLGDNSTAHDNIDDVSYSLLSQNGFALSSYLIRDEVVLYEKGGIDNRLAIDDDVFAEYIRKGDSLRISASIRNSLPIDHRSAVTKGVYGMYVTLAFKDGNGEQMYKLDRIDGEGNLIYSDTFVDKVNYKTYKLDVNDMVGNPYVLPSFTEQFQIYDIDKDTFSHVEKIWIASSGFVENNGTYIPNIWFKDIGLQVLQEIADEGNGYKLSMNYPNGTFFKQGSEQTILRAHASLVYNKISNLSESATWFWFKKNIKINSSSSEGYNAMGGSGWEWIDSAKTNEISVRREDLTAYENEYKVVVDYKSKVRLTTTFTIFNEDNRCTISISSSKGLEFSFDAGSTILTASMIKNENGQDEEVIGDCKCEWSSTDSSGQKRWFDPNEQENLQNEKAALKGELDGIISDQRKIAKDSTKPDAEKRAELDVLSKKRIDLQKKINQVSSAMRDSDLANFTFKDGTYKVEYEINAMNSFALIECAVYEYNENSDEYDIYRGTASINLVNDKSVSKSDYSLVIENGTQVFQYNEACISPSHERWGTEAQEILPLRAILYGPGGNIVNTASFSWEIPVGDTLIIASQNDLPFKEGSSDTVVMDGEYCYFDIEDKYSVSSANRQITCVANLDGVEIRQDTDFVFTKVGENGTNGTDIVCRIGFTNGNTESDDTFIHYIYKIGNGGLKWRWKAKNTENIQSTSIANLKFKLHAYRNGQEISEEDISALWQLTSSGYFGVVIDNNGESNLTIANANSNTNNLILRCAATINGKVYYTFYPIPYIKYPSGYNNNDMLSFDRQHTLRYVTYNSAGHYPVYEKEIGVWIEYFDKPWTATWGVNGEYIEVDRNRSSGVKKDSFEVDDSGSTLFPYVNVTPKEFYNGLDTNNAVTCTLTINNNDINIYVPICMTLNRYELMNLNQWDGNSVKVSQDGDDDAYILAPQIGAGIKGRDNSFTGILMGDRKIYSEVDNVENIIENVGLFGYSDGKQSIFLDAETGSAHFGLAETSDPRQNGNINLIPNGDSNIGNWNIGKYSLYSVYNQAPGEADDNGKFVNPVLNADKDGITDHPGSGGNGMGLLIKEDGTTEPVAAYKTERIPGDLGINAIKNIITSNNSSSSVKPYYFKYNASGVILNALPAYLSVKGLNVTENDIEDDNTAGIVRVGDSFEVELDPNSWSPFSIFHHTYVDNNGTKEFGRETIAGIDRAGRFYTNSVQSERSSMNIGIIGAFTHTISDQRNSENYPVKYLGPNFGYVNDGNEVNILRIFTDSKKSLDPVHISSSSTLGNDYQRAIHLHGKELKGFISASASTLEETNIFYNLDQYGFHVQREQGISADFGINDNGYKNDIRLMASNNFNVEANNVSMTASGSNKKISLVSAGQTEIVAGSHITLNNTSGDIYLTSNSGDIVSRMLGNKEYQVYFGSSNNETTRLKLGNSFFTFQDDAAGNNCGHEPGIYYRQSSGFSGIISASAIKLMSFGRAVQIGSSNTVTITSYNTSTACSNVYGNGNAADMSRLTLYGSNQGTGTFTLQSACGTMGSTNNLINPASSAQNRLGIKITSPLQAENTLYVGGTTETGIDKSIYTSKGMEVLNGNIDIDKGNLVLHDTGSIVIKDNSDNNVASFSGSGIRTPGWTYATKFIVDDGTENGAEVATVNYVDTAVGNVPQTDLSNYVQKNNAEYGYVPVSIAGALTGSGTNHSVQTIDYHLDVIYRWIAAH